MAGHSKWKQIKRQKAVTDARRGAGFSTRGLIPLTLARGADADEVALAAIDAGAEDFVAEGDTLSVYTRPDDLEAVRKALIEAGHAPASAEIARAAASPVPLGGRGAGQ